MIRQLVVMFVLSLIACLLLASQQLAVLKATGEGLATIIGYIIGYTLTLIILSMLMAAVPRLLYWVMKKKRLPDYFILVWSIWILLIASLLFNRIHNDLAVKNSSTDYVSAGDGQEVYKKLTDSIFLIYGKDSKDNATTKGSAVAVTREFLATNCHIIEDEDYFTIVINKVERRGAIYSKHGDLCIITIEDQEFAPVEIRSSATVEIGERVYAIGNPASTDKTISDGIISNKYNLHGNTMLQTNAAISHGSSGGGLFDSSGKLVGITTAMLDPSKTQNINFVLPTELIMAAILEPIPLQGKAQRNIKPQPVKLDVKKPEYRVLGTYGEDDVILAAFRDTCFITMIGRYNPKTVMSLAIWMPEVPNGVLLFSRTTKLIGVFEFLKWFIVQDNVKLLPSKSFMFHDDKLEPLKIFSINNTVQSVYSFMQEESLTEELIAQDHFVAQFYDRDRQGYAGMTTVEFGLNGFTEALSSLNQLCK